MIDIKKLRENYGNSYYNPLDENSCVLTALDELEAARAAVENYRSQVIASVGVVRQLHEKYVELEAARAEIEKLRAFVRAADELERVVGWSALEPIEGYDPDGSKLWAAREKYLNAGKTEDV